MRRRLPSPAMIVSIVALIAALGGTAYAQGLIGGGQIRNNSVTGADIKNRSVRGLEIKNSTIRSRDIQAGSLKTRDVTNGSLLSEDFAPGQLPAGAQGPAGPTRFALINEAGQIEEQSGGFTVRSFGENPNVYVDAGSSLAGKGLSATIALQNGVDVDGAAGADPNFTGEVSIARCATPQTTCAPAGTNEEDTLVVRASNSDGTPTTATTRKRFYVTIIG